MGQKVNPHGIRVGVIKDWDSRWFASKKDFSDNLVEDHKIRTELKAQLKDAGVPKIEIERTVDPSTSAPRVTVNIYCAKPGMVIGKGGEERVALQNKLTKEYGKTVIVNVIEVKSAATNAQLVAEDIARQLEIVLRAFHRLLPHQGECGVLYRHTRFYRVYRYGGGIGIQRILQSGHQLAGFL